MYLVYIDDSYENPVQAYSGIAIHETQWRQVSAAILDWRRDLKRDHGILIRKEFHATQFVSGQGRLGASIVTKHARSQIFRQSFNLLNQMEGVRIFSSCRRSRPEWAFERMVTRIQRTMQAWDERAILICDEGKEIEFTILVRKMGVYNPVPVYIGPRSLQTQNIATVRILEDPIFKDSSKSYLIQMADFVAYGLLRREKFLDSKNKYGIHECFGLLDRVVVREASPGDPMGVIR